ncbi:MAG: hypothetical protein JXN60_09680 [Lentisphaerae bacterium]|nr:hypothetical protein [Lentisphaerota bacterium]
MNSYHRFPLWINTVCIGLLFLTGSLINLHYSHMGFMPLDQSIVFDGAWRVLTGQIPYRDFTTPSGIIPILIQAAMFAIFGVSWFSYCLHAAIVNGLFCLTAYYLLIQCGISRPLSFFYAALSGIVLYPPIGTPYPEQHAAFFLLVAIWLMTKACRAEGKGRVAIMWMSCSVFLFLCFLSKQNVALLGIFPLATGFFVFLHDKQSLFNGLKYTAVGIVICGLVAVLAAVILKMDPSQIWVYGFMLPYQTILTRLTTGDMVPFAAHDATIGSGMLWGRIAIVFSGVLFIFLSALSRHRNTNIRRAVGQATVGFGMIIFCALLAETTSNQSAQCYWFLFIAVGLAHAAILTVLPDRDHRITSLCVHIFFISLTLKGAYLFNNSVNETRIVHDITFGETEIQRPMVPALKFMLHQSPIFYCVKARDIDELARYFEINNGNFLLFGDTSILYAITGRPSVFPALWYHNGLTTPEKDTEAFRRFNRNLKNNIRAYNVKYLVLEANGTWNGSKVSDFPAINELLLNRITETQQIGPFRVLRLTNA